MIVELNVIGLRCSQYVESRPNNAKCLNKLDFWGTNEENAKIRIRRIPLEIFCQKQQYYTAIFARYAGNRPHPNSVSFAKPSV